SAAARTKASAEPPMVSWRVATMASRKRGHSATSASMLSLMWRRRRAASADVAGAELLGGEVTGRALALGEAPLADDGEVLLLARDDLGELLVVRVAQLGVLRTEDGAAGAELLDAVDDGDEGVGDLDRCV